MAMADPTLSPASSAEKFISIMNQALKETKAKEGKPLSVAFLGSRGSFTDAACQAFFSGANVTTKAVGKPSFEHVFSAVESGEVSAGIVPIESTWSGSFARCYDCLLQHKGVEIVGEISALDPHCFCVLPGTDKAGIVAVHSHPDIMLQCSGFIDGLSKEVKKISDIDSATACATVKKLNDKTHACICSPAAAKFHGLEVLETGVANDSNSASRYIIISAAGKTSSDAKTETTNADAKIIKDAMGGGIGGDGVLKCTIAVTMHNEAQGLFKVLSCFALRDINVTKLDSRPSSSALGSILDNSSHWEYVFFIDFEPRNLKAIETVMTNVREYTSSLRILGTYTRNLKLGKVRLSLSSI